MEHASLFLCALLRLCNQTIYLLFAYLRVQSFVMEEKSKRTADPGALDSLPPTFQLQIVTLLEIEDLLKLHTLNKQFRRLLKSNCSVLRTPGDAQVWVALNNEEPKLWVCLVRESEDYYDITLEGSKIASKTKISFSKESYSIKYATSARGSQMIVIEHMKVEPRLLKTPEIFKSPTISEASRFILRLLLHHFKPMIVKTNVPTFLLAELLYLFPHHQFITFIYNPDCGWIRNRFNEDDFLRSLKTKLSSVREVLLYLNNGVSYSFYEKEEIQSLETFDYYTNSLFGSGLSDENLLKQRWERFYSDRAFGVSNRGLGAFLRQWALRQRRIVDFMIALTSPDLTEIVRGIPARVVFEGTNQVVLTRSDGAELVVIVDPTEFTVTASAEPGFEDEDIL